LSIIGDPGSLYHLEDSQISSLKRENDELFVKETIPSLHIQQVIIYYKTNIDDIVTYLFKLFRTK